MNEYIQKYGDNAIQAYKKSLRISQSLQKDNPSPTKQQSHFLPKKSLSKRSLKSKRNDSQARLTHSKSIKNVSKLEDETRKKGSSFFQPSKKLSLGVSNGLFHTFNKISNPIGKKKLTIVDSTNTPKSTTSKLHFNLNLNKHQQQHKQPSTYIDTKDNPTQRIQRLSGKKNIDKCSTSQSKHNLAKRSFLSQVEMKMQEILSCGKKTLKQLIKGIKESFEIILMNEEDVKLRKTFLLIKQVVQRVGGIAQRYKSKYTRASERIQSLQKIHEAYLLQSQVHHSRSKSNKPQSQTLPRATKKASSIEMIILNQNYELRRKIHKLQKQLEYYASQSASLMNVFGKFKSSQSQFRMMSNQQDNYQTNSPNYEQHKATSKSNNKLQKRRSSQNLFYNSSHNPFAYGGEKRLSFDPGVLETGGTEGKKVHASLYSSVGSSVSNQRSYQQDDEYRHVMRNQQNQGLEELSEEEDSDNQE